MVIRVRIFKDHDALLVQLGGIFWTRQNLLAETAFQPSMQAREKLCKFSMNIWLLFPKYHFSELFKWTEWENVPDWCFDESDWATFWHSRFTSILPCRYIIGAAAHIPAGMILAQLMHLCKQYVAIEVLEPLIPLGNPRHLISAWVSTGYYGHLGKELEDGRALAVSLTLFLNLSFLSLILYRSAF